MLPAVHIQCMVVTWGSHGSHMIWTLYVSQYDPKDVASASKLFSVPDFIGFACREVASRIRGAVAAVPFEQFHKYSTEIIRAGVFGKAKDGGGFREELVFSANNLVGFCYVADKI